MQNEVDSGRRDAYVALLTGVVAAAIFGCYIAVFFPPELQFHKYPNAAVQYLAGTLPSERIPDFSPLYFYLHLILVRIFGGGTTFIGFIHVAAAACSASLLYLLLRRWCSLTVSLVGVTAFVLNRSMAIYSSVFEPEVLLVFFLVLFLWAIDATIRQRDLVAGFALALCVLTRPTLLPMLAVVPWYLSFRNGSRDWRRSVPVFLALPLLALILLSWRNHSTGADFSPVVMNPGFVFFEANNPLASGQSAVYPPLVAELRNEIGGEPDTPHTIYRMLARIEAGEHLSTAAVNRYWWSRGVQYISDYPLVWLKLELHKLYVLWHEHRRYDLLPAYSFDRILHANHIPAMPFALVSSAALFGMLTSWRRWRDYVLCYALFAIQLASMLIFYISDRQRTTLIPLFVIFACVGVTEVLRIEVRSRRLSVCSGIVLAAIFFSVPSDRMLDDLHLWDSDQRCNQFWRHGALMREIGNIPEAARAYALSFAVAPWVEDSSRPDHVSYNPDGFAGRAVTLWPELARHGASATFDRGILLLSAGKLEDAERIFRDHAATGRRFDRGHLQSSLPELYLGTISLLRGDPAQARRWWEDALEKVPGEPFTLANLAVLTGSTLYHDQLVRYFGRVEADWLLGRAMLLQGKPAAAEEMLTRLVSGLPDFRRGLIYLAAAHGAAGNSARGVELYLKAIENRPAPLMLETAILNLFADYARSQPDNYRAHLWHGLVLSQFGYFREGVDALERALVLHPAEEISSELRSAHEILSTSNR